MFHFIPQSWRYDVLKEEKWGLPINALQTAYSAVFSRGNNIGQNLTSISWEISRSLDIILSKPL